MGHSSMLKQPNTHPAPAGALAQVVDLTRSTFQARVRPIALRDAGRAGLVDEAAERAAGDEGAGESDNRFYFTAEISSMALDAFYTHMADSTLRNFARDAAEGVALLDSHDGYKLGVGYSAGGRYEEENGDGRALGLFYIVPGIRFGGAHSFASTDDYIRAIESGTVRDVSVGFYDARWVCDLCKQPYFGQDSNCPHIAGWEYEVDEDGRQVRRTCTVTIHDASLSEVSLVYDGATPGAMILKAEQEAEAGRMTPAMIRQYEREYRTRLPQPATTGRAGQDVVVSGIGWRQTTQNAGDLTIGSGDARVTPGDRPAGKKRGQGVTMKDERGIETAEAEIVVDAEVTEGQQGQVVDDEARAQLDAIRQVTLQTAAPQGVPLVDSVRWLNEQLAEATRQRDEARQEVARLQPLADQGHAYRGELVDQAVAEGVRAMGEAFPVETYRAMLADAPLEHIRQVRDTFAAQAAVRFPGGRLTQDGAKQESNEPQRQTPAAAYGAQ